MKLEWSSFGGDVTAEEASVVSAPCAVSVEAVSRHAEEVKVSPAAGSWLRGNQIAILALRAVAVGLGKFSKLELKHDSSVMVDI